MWYLVFILFFATPIVRASNVNYQTNSQGSSSGACVLPAYPEHGGYSVANVSNSAPGQTLGSAILNVGCSPGFEVQGRSSVFCINGIWSEDMPRCVRTGETSASKTEDMDCGTVAAPGEQLQSGVRSARPGSVPWHAVVYSKRAGANKYICAGSLVTRTAVISVAHCFWENKVKSASDYAVAVGKIYNFWDDTMDIYAQKFDVKDIKVPVRYQDVAANYQADIAIVILTSPVQYNAFVKPVCLDFDFEFERKQLQNGNFGKVASWGLTMDKYNLSNALKVVDIPYVDVEDCVIESSLGFREYITFDKICAGFANGTAICKGDTGAGLVFPEHHLGSVRYYLRGVVSIAPRADGWCSPSYIAFTQVTKHQQFITTNLI